MLNEAYTEFKKNLTKETFDHLVDCLLQLDESEYFKNNDTNKICRTVRKNLIGNTSHFFHLNEKEAKFLIRYLSGQYAKDCIKIPTDFNIEILSNEEYQKKYGKSYATCENYGNQKYSMVYSSTIVELLTSGNWDSMIRGLQTVFHEPTHLIQGNWMESNEFSTGIYKMIMETIVRKADPNFYQANYNQLLKEILAEEMGLSIALSTISKDNASLWKMVNQDYYNEKLEGYKQKRKNIEKGSFFKKDLQWIASLDTITASYISKHKELIEQYPTLKLVYNEDGTKKTVLQLIEERKNVIEKIDDLEKVNNFYEFVANQKNYRAGGLKGTWNEIYELMNYLNKNGMEDEYAVNLLKFRLKKVNKENWLSYVSNANFIDSLGQKLNEEEGFVK